MSSTADRINDLCTRLVEHAFGGGDRELELDAARMIAELYGGGMPLLVSDLIDAERDRAARRGLVAVGLEVRADPNG